jgi:hypothetical protein
VVKEGQLIAGTCSSQGYSSPNGTLSESAGPCGTIVFKLYEKASETPLVATGVSTGSKIVLETFARPVHTWTQMNDPVMGGKSTGTFTIAGGVGVFNGSVVDVPFLQAPGFIKVSSSDSVPYPDVSSCSALELTVVSSTAYAGYRVSFGTVKGPSGFFSYGYKAHFMAPLGSVGSVVIPFTNFSDDWDDATGNIKVSCAANSAYCPDAATLKNMKTISVWGEGVAGDVHLEISEIAATGCTTSFNDAGIKAADSSISSTCSQPIQPNLRYNISNTQGVKSFPFPLPATESLATAVCCDTNFASYAEPRFLFQDTDVDMFGKLDPTVETTFYDSSCGIPLFVVPRGRTFADFKADTTEHGWPSFRAAELVPGSSYIVNATGEVLSKCGTHLGSYLPDSKGPRWCLDLSCVSGNPASK